jgi:tetratricopeptide (TPR) repeat protein
LRVTFQAAAVLVILAVVSCAAAVPQESPQILEVRSILREASALVPKIEEMQQPSVAANIAHLQVDAGDLAGAMETVRSIEKNRSYDLALGSIALALADQGDLTQALQLIKNSAGHYKAGTYLWIAQHLAERSDFEHALSVARLIANEPNQMSTFVDTLMRVYRLQYKAGDKPGATQTLNEALDTAVLESTNPGSARLAIAGLYSNIARAVAETGNQPAAFSIVERIYEMIAEEKNLEQKQMLLRDLAFVEANLGEFSAASRIAEGLPPGRSRDAVFEVIAMGRANRGDPFGALDDAALVAFDPWRNSSFEVISIALAGSGYFARGITAIDNVQGAGERAYGLSQLAHSLSKKGDPAAAYALSLATEAARSAGSETKPFVFAEIAVTQGMLGDLPLAIETANAVEDDTHKAWALWNLTEMMVEAGKKDEALELARNQTAPHPKAYALAGIAQGVLEQMKARAKKRAHPRTE